jgi:HAD superfamily hydrolase (TIGR01509 family)
VNGSITIPGLPGRFRAVVFDLDGLLVDTEPLWMRAKAALLEGHGARFDHADHVAVLGTSDAWTADYFARRLGLGPEHSEPIRLEYLELMGGFVSEGVTLRPGAREVVDAWRGAVPLGLASNTRRFLVDRIVGAAALAGCFDTVATGDEVAAPKPAPDVYLLACRRLGVSPSEALAVEDSPAGVQSAAAAAMTVVGVPSEESADLSGATLVVETLLDLLPATEPT